MIVDDVIRDLATTDGFLPEEAMRWALDHWDQAGPRFISMLERYADGSDRSQEAEDALIIIVHLLGEKRETRAFPGLCRLIRDADAAELVLGDVITETLEHILISIFDGDAALLKAVIEDASADEFVRETAFEAMAYLCRTGRIPEDGMRAYLLRLFDEMEPRDDNSAWTGWVTAVSLLGYQDLAAKAEDLIERFVVPAGSMDVADFREDLGRTLGDPERMAG